MPFLRTLYARILERWHGSIRSRLTWSFALASLVMVLSGGAVVYWHHQQFLYQEGETRASNLAHLLAISSSSWVAANDLVGLQEVTQSFSGTQDLRFAAIVSRQGEVLASTQGQQLGHFFTDELSQHMLKLPPRGPLMLVVQADLIDVAMPILVGARHIGWARIELTRRSTNEHLQAIRSGVLGFAGAATLIAALIGVLLSRYLTRRLDHLVQVVGEVVRSGRSLQAQAMGKDEIGTLGRDFNHMVRVLDAQQRYLEQRNAELALYNRILQQIGHDAPLPQVLKELTQQIEAIMPSTLCAVLRLTAPEHCLAVCAAPSLPACCRIALEGVPLEQTGSSGVAIHSAARAVTENIAHDPDCLHGQALAQGCPARSSWSQPLIDSTQRVMGVLTLFRSEIGAPSDSDITLIERCAALASLAMEREEQEEGLRIAVTAFESQQGMCMYILRADRCILRVNRAFTEITGFSAEQVLGQPVQMLRALGQDPALYAMAWETIEKTGSWQGEVVGQRSNGESYHQWLALTAVHNKSGTAVSHYVGSFFDLTERKKVEAEIERLAYYDALTGLPNRRLLLDHLKLLLGSMGRLQKHAALLFMDLDNFKSINDTLGHDKGDLLLQQVGLRLSNNVRAHDTVARFGGDEFVILLDALPQNQQDAVRDVRLTGEKLLSILRQPYTLGDTLYHSTASMGATVFSANSRSTIEDLLKQADLALYQAKAGGRDALRFFQAPPPPPPAP
ncbi:MAG: diguanylate cyclase [Burkholderiaceae bacterium]|nr:diguanylate cyclase [Burkholderiaceae bacterium]